MKKTVSVLLASAMALTISACNNNTPEPAYVIETKLPATQETTESPKTTEGTRETIQTDPNLAKYIKDNRDKYKHLENEESGEYHAPEILIKSAYADEINKDVAHVFEDYATEIKKEGECHYFATEYIAYLTKEGILSVVFVECGEWDDDEYHVYNIDVSTGEKVDNKRIAEAAGITDIRETAMNAVQSYYNATGLITVRDFKVVTTNDEDLDGMEQEIENSFSEERLNENMMMGLRSDGTIFFISELGSFGGASSYYYMYNTRGSDLRDYDSPYWVSGFVEDE